LSDWYNLTPAMRCHAVNTAVMQPCYLATSFIGGRVLTGPLATPWNRHCWKPTIQCTKIWAIRVHLW